MTRCAKRRAGGSVETTGQPEGKRTPRVIKRYANRKLYDTRESRYVTLQQIAKLVREGEEVSIIDNTTKEDLTNVTLAQILYEEEKKGADTKGVSSVGALRQLIQQGGERLMSSLRDGPMGKLIARRDEPAPEEPDGEREKEARKSVLSSPKEAFDELQRLADDRVRGVLGNALTHVQQLQSEVKRLQARIEELEEKLVRLARRKDESGRPPPGGDAEGS
ncbi:MAG: polyhydroxyalkanoate synthesis regulator DNA-binding domain-containing protein [Sandaracinaceae bacterium]|nr:polyhydroxyalkanoate synthesis regulator DNA-binding domain-containing protein [Sandaracinaceae bacterium]